MKLTSTSFADNQRIPSDYAFCTQDSRTHTTFGPNQNPQLGWGELPMGTKSLVVICHDPDVPSLPDDVNKEGRKIPSNLARIDFFHWVLVDLDPLGGPIEAGEFSDGVTPHGKAGPQGPRGTRQGLNDYTAWFATTEEMKGDYFGYDGPCPPWNDSIVHRYVFTLYALDFARVPLEGKFSGPDVLKAIEGHVLAQAQLTGTYTLNRRLA